MNTLTQAGISRDRCFIVAEVAQAHDGSVGSAHAYIDVAADAGADAVKFQTHIARAESTLDEPWRVRFSKQDDTRYDYWQRMEFTPSQWQELSAHCRERGITFMSSPFSGEAVDLLAGARHVVMENCFRRDLQPDADQRRSGNRATCDLLQRDELAR